MSRNLSTFKNRDSFDKSRGNIKKPTHRGNGSIAQSSNDKRQFAKRDSGNTRQGYKKIKRPAQAGGRTGSTKAQQKSRKAIAMNSALSMLAMTAVAGHIVRQGGSSFRQEKNSSQDSQSDSKAVSSIDSISGRENTCFAEFLNSETKNDSHEKYDNPLKTPQLKDSLDDTNSYLYQKALEANELLKEYDPLKFPSTDAKKSKTKNTKKLSKVQAKHREISKKIDEIFADEEFISNKIEILDIVDQSDRDSSCEQLRDFGKSDVKLRKVSQYEKSEIVDSFKKSCKKMAKLEPDLIINALKYIDLFYFKDIHSTSVRKSRSEVFENRRGDLYKKAPAIEIGSDYSSGVHSPSHNFIFLSYGIFERFDIYEPLMIHEMTHFKQQMERAVDKNSDECLKKFEEVAKSAEDCFSYQPEQGDNCQETREFAKKYVQKLSDKDEVVVEDSRCEEVPKLKEGSFAKISDKYIADVDAFAYSGTKIKIKDLVGAIPPSGNVDEFDDMNADDRRLFRLINDYKRHLGMVHKKVEGDHDPIKNLIYLMEKQAGLIQLYHSRSAMKELCGPIDKINFEDILGEELTSYYERELSGFGLRNPIAREAYDRLKEKNLASSDNYFIIEGDEMSKTGDGDKDPSISIKPSKEGSKKLDLGLVNSDRSEL